MAQKTVIDIVCDGCGAVDDTERGGKIKVEHHEMTIDKAGGTGDYCEKCWGPFAKAAEKILATMVGMRGKRKSLLQDAA